jgi:L-threonylcarbamoyladenylate synthase
MNHATREMRYSQCVTLHLTPDDLDQAASLLRDGGLVAMPTETVYGLAADATDDRAVAAIFAAKGRPHFNPLIVHVADTTAARALARFDARADALAQRFWPGPLTLVLPRRADCPVSLLASAGLDTLALRVPGHGLARALIERAGVPLAAPSANRSGRISPTHAAHVAAELDGRIDAILDGGPCPIGVESTVLDLAGERACLLRPGGVPLEVLVAILGAIDRAGAAGASPRGPGMLESHYAPTLPLRLDALTARPGEALLAFGPSPTDTTLSLSPSGDLGEAAANLFAMLRTLDRPDFTAIAVMPIPEHGLGLAINDRLNRAAAGLAGRAPRG